MPEVESQLDVQPADIRVPAGPAGGDALALRELPPLTELPALPPAAELHPPAGERAAGPALPLTQVIAVLVAHDGAPFLPRAIAALTAQTRPPDRVVVVDTGSRDGGSAMLARLRQEIGAQVLRLPRRTSFGDAVQAALTTLDGGTLQHDWEPRPRSRPGAAVQVPTWLWLLHDDCAPEPDALRTLLETVDAGPSIGIAGCKQVAWDDPKRLLDVGFTVSRLGARVTGVDVGDVDQGQLDHRSDVLAVSTAGMLVRRDVWDLLGGPDPALTHVRDDLDLCRRAHQAGHRVVVQPRAVVAHARASATHRRGAGSSDQVSWWRHDRRDAVHLRLAGTPWPLLPFALLWTVLATAARTLALLVLKQPERAGAEASALALVLLSPASWLRARRRAAGSRRLPRRSYRALLAGGRQTMRQRRDTFSAYLREQEEAWARAEEPVSEPPTDGFAIARVTGVGTGAGVPPAVSERRRARALEAPEAGGSGPAPTTLALAAGLGAAVVAAIGLRPLLSGTGPASGPALLPAPDAAGTVRDLAGSAWRPVELGAAAVADPLLTGLAGLATLLGGSTRAAVDTVLLGALPLAALTAWWAAGAATSSRALRLWAALTWAAAPALLPSVAAGRLGAVAAHVLLPLAAVAVARSVGAAGPPPRPAPPGSSSPRPRGSVAAASAAGLLLTAVLAGAPALALPVAAGLLATAVVARTRRGVLAWTAAVPLALLLPWWLAVIGEPRLLLAEPGGPTAGRTAAEAGGWHLLGLPADPAGYASTPFGSIARGIASLLGSPSVDADAVLRAGAVLLAAPLVLLALGALLRPGRRGLAAAVCWLLALGGLAVAGLAPRLFVAVGERHGWPGPGLSLLLLGLLGAALIRLDGAAARLRARSLGRRHVLALVTGAVVVAGPVLAAAGWAWQGWNAGPEDGWVRRTDPDVLPAVAAAEAEGPAATRTLVLRVLPQGIRWSVARSGGPRLGDGSAALATAPADGDPGTKELLEAVGGLLSDTGRDERARLDDLGIGSVLLLPPADDAAQLALDTSPGLVRVAAPDGAVLWRVELDTGEPPGGTAAGDAVPGAEALAAGDGPPSRPARVRILAPDGRRPLAALPSAGLGVDTELPPGPAGRVLVLAERADPGWEATLDGRPLGRTAHADWAQAFVLPAQGGHLLVTHSAPGEPALGAARAGLAGLALLMAIPLPRRRLRWRPPPRAAAAAPAAPLVDVVDLYEPDDYVPRLPDAEDDLFVFADLPDIEPQVAVEVVEEDVEDVEEDEAGAEEPEPEPEEFLDEPEEVDGLEVLDDVPEDVDGLEVLDDEPGAAEEPEALADETVTDDLPAEVEEDDDVITDSTVLDLDGTPRLELEAGPEPRSDA